MKEILNVKKSEAKQIGLWGICILDPKSNYLMISRAGCFTFEYFCGTEQDILDYENEYKNYEWRLTDLKKLKHGDVCKVEYPRFKKTIIYVFDRIGNIYFKEKGEYVEVPAAIMWHIEKERPIRDTPYKDIYKLFKKGEKEC